MPKSQSKKISGEKTFQYYDPLWSPEKPRKPKKKFTRKLFPECDLQFEMDLGPLGPLGPIPSYFPSRAELERGFMSPFESPSETTKIYPWKFKLPEEKYNKERCEKIRIDCAGLAEAGAIQKWQTKIKVLNRAGDLIASDEWLATYGDTTLELLGARPWHFPIKII